MKLSPQRLRSFSLLTAGATTTIVVVIALSSSCIPSSTAFVAPPPTTALNDSSSNNSNLNKQQQYPLQQQQRTTSSSTTCTTKMAAKKSSGSSLDDALANWVKEAGYGTITSTTNSGSSGWASFRQMTVSDPPRNDLKFFVKTSSRSSQEMFEGEALGLRAMFECSQQQQGGEEEEDALLKIPEVFYWGDYNGGSFLVMEYLSLSSGRGGSDDDFALGKAMARMHLTKADSVPKAGNPQNKFGFNVDNTIGGTPQPNPWTKGNTKQDWIDFYSKHRIQHQLVLAGYQDLIDLWNNDIAPRLSDLFDDVEDIQPSLLHGDLWSGNIGSSTDDKPSIYDPAVYWGHHEAEWGMSWCAGFGPKFWQGYRSLIPEDPGFKDRKPLYDAYHQLNHYNLFGGGYINSARSQLGQVKRSLDKKGA